MITTASTAKTLRKNTICPTGTASPSQRTSADITANISAEASLNRIPLTTFMGREGGGGTRPIEHVRAVIGSLLALGLMVRRRPRVRATRGPRVNSAAVSNHGTARAAPSFETAATRASSGSQDEGG